MVLYFSLPSPLRFKSGSAATSFSYQLRALERFDPLHWQHQAQNQFRSDRMAVFAMSTSPIPKPRKETILQLLERKEPPKPLTTLSDFIKKARDTTERWQKEDWRDAESDEDVLFNNVRIVAQVWFRGQPSLDLSLRPGLYREKTYVNLRKLSGSPKPSDEVSHRFDELFDLEHELRVDFTSFGHLLNQAREAESAADWYFLMQHHGVPTRLLDWTTNALAALFFALDGYKSRRDETDPSGEAKCTVSVWMVDAYWLSWHLSDEWRAPLLAWSSDAIRYIPPLQTLVDKMEDSKALLPMHAMPIEPPSIHPRVAAQEGRFIIFGRTEDLVEEEIRLEQMEDCSGIEEMRLEQLVYEAEDIDAVLRDLAQLGVSRRTLFPDFSGLADFVKWKHFHKLRGYVM